MQLLRHAPQCPTQMWYDDIVEKDIHTPPLFWTPFGGCLRRKIAGILAKGFWLCYFMGDFLKATTANLFQNKRTRGVWLGGCLRRKIAGILAKGFWLCYFMGIFSEKQPQQIFFKIRGQGEFGLGLFGKKNSWDSCKRVLAISLYGDFF